MYYAMAMWSSLEKVTHHIVIRGWRWIERRLGSCRVAYHESKRTICMYKTRTPYKEIQYRRLFSKEWNLVKNRFQKNWDIGTDDKPSDVYALLSRNTLSGIENITFLYASFFSGKTIIRK
jgi:hypothetical protein